MSCDSCLSFLLIFPPSLLQVSHILNVAFGVENAFPDLFIYKTVSILDHPDADLLLHMQECCDFIQQARNEVTITLNTTDYIHWCIKQNQSVFLERLLKLLISYQN